MIRRIFVALAVIMAVLIAAAAYLLYTPGASMPVGPVEVRSLDIGGHSRQYTVFSPSNLQTGASVLIAFHPSKSDGREMRGFVG
jgi:poly(3-hydroxybutyrate) depolymerase